MSMIQKILFTLFIIFSVSIASANKISEKIPHWQKVSYIEKSFYEIALRSEYNTNVSRVRKWNEPLIVYVEHGVGDQALHLRLVKMHLKHLSEITGLKVSYTQSKNEANIHLYLTQSNQVNSLIRKEISQESVKTLRNSVCLANIRRNKQSEIKKAIVIIPIDRARMHGKLISCIVEELTQILGLPNDSKTIYPTIFSDKNIYKLLTGLDYLLLKILYSNDIKNGMTQSEIIPILRNKLNRWKRDGTIKKAQENVIKGELYQLLGYR